MNFSLKSEAGGGWRGGGGVGCLGAMNVFLIHRPESFQHTLNNLFPLGTGCNRWLAATNPSDDSSSHLSGLLPLGF